MSNAILELLRSDGSIVINKSLAHAIGLHEAILFSDLISKMFYFKERDQLQNGFFFNTAENIEKDTTLSAKQQRLAISNLERIGLITTTIKGVPAKKYFKINQNNDCLSKLMLEGKQNQQFGKKVIASMAETSQQVEQKGKRNNTNNDFKNNNKDYIILNQNDGIFISFFLSVYAERFDTPHPTLTVENYNRVLSVIEAIQ